MKWLILDNILRRDGLSFALLRDLSYKSDIGIRLKKNLHYFDKNMLLNELVEVNKWYEICEYLHDMTIDYRIKKHSIGKIKV